MFLAAAGQQQGSAAAAAAAAQPGNAAERARRHIEAASSVVARTIGEAFGACCWQITVCFPVAACQPRQQAASF